MTAHTSVNPCALPACPCWVLPWPFPSAHCQDTVPVPQFPQRHREGADVPCRSLGPAPSLQCPPSPRGRCPGTAAWHTSLWRASPAPPQPQSPGQHSLLPHLTAAWGTSSCPLVTFRASSMVPRVLPLSPQPCEQPTPPRGTRGSPGCGCRPGWHRAGGTPGTRSHRLLFIRREVK